MIAIQLAAAVALFVSIAAQAAALIPLKIEALNCTDVNYCGSSTCTSYLTAFEGSCVSLGSTNNAILNASYATMTLVKSPYVCAPIKVYFNDSTCSGTPAETLWTPCGTCLQYPARQQNCEIASNGTFLVRVKSCGNDNTCGECAPYDNAGLPPKTCYAHPDVPGLFLEYNNLEACAAVLVNGFSDSKCTQSVAQTVMPVDQCFGGLVFHSFR